MSEHAVFLPGGYVDDAGTVHREVLLRPLTGREEEIIADPAYQGYSARLVTAILASCVQRIDTITEVDKAIALQLLIGDRDFLILQLRRITFGDTIERVMVCPNPECGQKMDVDIDVDEIKIKHQRDPKPAYELELSELAAYQVNGRAHRRVAFRLPNGSDHEAISELLKTNEAEAYTRLYARCVQQIGDITPVDEETMRNVSMLARQEIAMKMNEMAPGPDLDLAVDCPECGQHIQIPFEIPGFFLTNY